MGEDRGGRVGWHGRGWGKGTARASPPEMGTAAAAEQHLYQADDAAACWRGRQNARASIPCS